MRRRAKTVGKAAKATRKTKRRGPLRRGSAKSRKRVREPTDKVAELRKQLAEALEQQTATSEVLQVINASAGELSPIFDTLLQKAISLCEANFGNLFLHQNGYFSVAALRGATAAYADSRRIPFTLDELHAEVPLVRAARTKEVVEVTDSWKDPAYIARDPKFVEMVELAGARTLIIVPMLKDDRLIGAIAIYRKEVGRFSERQIALVSNFAAQAVIAIENARLLTELRQRTAELTEALGYQTATGEILTVISRSPTDAQPVFDIIGERAERLCEAEISVVTMVEGGLVQLASIHGVSTEGIEAVRALHPLALDRETVSTRTIRTAAVVHVPDVLADSTYDPKIAAVKAGWRACLGVPMTRDGQVIGTIFVGRKEPKPYTDNQIQLLKTFADQAVIAIGNVRLFKEVQQRTEDLTESLQQQTATADVLKIISRSSVDLETVLETLVETVARLCRADQVYMFHLRHDLWHLIADYGLSIEAREFFKTHPFTPGRGSTSGRAAMELRAVSVSDVLQDPEYTLGEGQAIAGYRSTLGVPLLRENTLIGIFSIARTRVEPFASKEIELATSFADQAVIAIENARLFNELRQRTDDLTEALEQQTATADVLKVISVSRGELQAGFNAILENATRICDAKFGNLWLSQEDGFLMAAMHGIPPEYRDRLKLGTLSHPGASLPASRAKATGKVVHVIDLSKDQSYLDREPVAVGAVEIGKARTLIAVPMLNDKEVVGVFALYRQKVRPFTDKQIELLQNFAAQAVIAIENARLLNELRLRTDDLTESLQQQKATSEILEVISNSPTNAQPAFDAIVRSGLKLFPDAAIMIALPDGDVVKPAAIIDADPAGVDALRARLPLPLSREFITSTAILDRREIDVADAGDVPKDLVAGAQNFLASGYRAITVMPMMRGDQVIGALSVMRRQAGALTEKQRVLLRTFANQAVIAIENTRLFNELRESLQQQTATADVLKVISRSTFDLQAVLNTLVESAARLCEADIGHIARPGSDGFFWSQADFGFSENLKQELGRIPFRAGPGSVTGRALLERKTVQIVDAQSDPEYTLSAAQKLGGYRTMLGTPMMREGEPIGVFGLARRSVRPFTERQIELLTSFADQAVIAIENARLLNELRGSLDQQTATSEVLQVIASATGELAPVFKAVLTNAADLCDAAYGALWLSEGDAFRTAALHGDLPRAYLDQWQSGTAFRPDPNVPMARVAATAEPVQVADLQESEAYLRGDRLAVSGVNEGGIRTVLAVPMLKDKNLVGVIAIYRREVRPFTDKQIEIVTNFAAQAVIAIENARLLKELRQRTEDLTESLAQQTATADVLKVISRSSFDLEPVFETLLESAARLCDGHISWIFQSDGEILRWSASYGHTPDVHARVRQFFKPLEVPIDRGSVVGRAATEGTVVHIPDVLADPEYTWGGAQKIGGYRACLGAPLLREGKVVGVLFVAKNAPQPFSEKQIELVKTFADQAVIAIENTRLFNELRESLQQQTATADVLKVISRSTFDLQTVLDTLVESAARLCEADMGSINRQRGQEFQQIASFGYSAEFNAYFEQHSIPGGRGSAVGRAVQERRIIQIEDVMSDPDYAFAEAAQIGGIRTLLAVPMMREGMPVGIFALQRRTVRPFTQKQIDLVETFADQAVIAIENVRLFESVEARTRELAQSLEDLQAAQNRLVQTQKLASLGQLTAGIAHEIKNPLNFVNNFSSLSSELLDELEETLKCGQFDDQDRAQIDDLTATLRANLKKIEQHGKRADSIVKNMLLHSREGSGEHRRTDINSVVDESLNLAYHGARAENRGFNITLERSFDPNAGEIDLFPQEITRVLLNLISNGFYAATKRRAEATEDAYEPILKATTKNLGDQVEIRIRDNGTGIPAEVKDKMFNPFFTTKPPGEGTGLGLSLSHDIIVKQHAGLIEVDTKPGEFTEFRIVLPRGAASIGKTGGPA